MRARDAGAGRRAAMANLHPFKALLVDSRKPPPMNGTIDLFTLLALIAAIVAIFKLRSVLGRRTSDDDARMEQRAQRAAEEARAAAASDKVVALPRRDRDLPEQPAPVNTISKAEREAQIRSFSSDNESLSKGLIEILDADPAFDPEQFLTGAKRAYEMIVTAFAEGNLKALRELLNDEVYDSFAGAIAERKKRGEQVDQSFVGISKSNILEADVTNGTANITVRFVSQLISAIRDKAGEVVSGDDSSVQDVNDIWTFARDVSSARALQSPNWKLISTQSSN